MREWSSRFIVCLGVRVRVSLCSVSWRVCVVRSCDVAGAGSGPQRPNQRCYCSSLTRFQGDSLCVLRATGGEVVPPMRLSKDNTERWDFISWVMEGS